MVQVQEVGSTARSQRVANITLWVLQVLLALAFLMAGASKLAGASAMVEQFEQLGLGQWFRYVTGALECVAAVLLVVPRASAFGALILMMVMIGAVTAHLVVFRNNPAPPLVFLTLAAIIAWGRRRQIAASLEPSAP